MKYRTIRKIRLIVLLATVILGIIILALMLRKEDYPIFIQILLMLILILICFESLKGAYKEYITLTRERYKQIKELNKEELEIVEDAIKLIKSVDENIEIAEFSVYRVKHIGDGWFNYDEDTHELSIFIPFDRYMKSNKDLCFMIVLHEILHSQNLRLNEKIFTKGFTEGINQFLTLWLINNYSTKYKIAKYMPIIYFRLRTRMIKLNKKQNTYKSEVKQAEKVIQNSKQCVKEIFLNYINLNVAFFKSFVPKKYIIK